MIKFILRYHKISYYLIRKLFVQICNLELAQTGVTINLDESLDTDSSIGGNPQQFLSVKIFSNVSRFSFPPKRKFVQCV